MLLLFITAGASVSKLYEILKKMLTKFQLSGPKCFIYLAKYHKNNSNLLFSLSCNDKNLMKKLKTLHKTQIFYNKKGMSVEKVLGSKTL